LLNLCVDRGVLDVIKYIGNLILFEGVHPIFRTFVLFLIITIRIILDFGHSDLVLAFAKDMAALGFNAIPCLNTSGFPPNYKRSNLLFALDFLLFLWLGNMFGALLLN